MDALSSTLLGVTVVLRDGAVSVVTVFYSVAVGALVPFFVFGLGGGLDR